LNKVIKFLDEHFEEYFMGVFLIGISCVMFLQIIMRFIGASLPWAEESCRYLYIGSVFLSMSFTIKKGIILRVDLLLSKLPNIIHKIVEIILQLVNIAFFIFMTYYSIITVDGIKISAQTSPAMELPMYLVYMIIPIGCFLAVVRSVQQLYLVVKNKVVKEEVDYSEAS